MEKYITLSDLYRFLALAIKYPQEQCFEDSFLNGLYEVAGQVDEVGSDLACCRQMFAEKAAKRLDHLQQEYTRLFINAYPHVIAPPYGSVYLVNGGLLFGDYTERVRAYYLEKGQALASMEHPPDYLCYQLEFMAVLAATDLKGLEEFIDQFFRPWYVLFKEKVFLNTDNSYIILVLKLIDYFAK